MFTQIYSMTSVEEALGVIASGADIIGIVPPQHLCNKTIPGEISDEMVKRIFCATEGKARRTILYTGEDVAVYYEGIRKYHPEIIHLSGEKVVSNAAFFKKAKAIQPSLIIEQVVPVGGSESIALAVARAQYADVLILDTISNAPDVVGASGNVNDWSIGKEIVKRVPIPVILAGGLAQDNVERAILMVHPAGVDSLSRTSVTTPEGEVRKDLQAVKEFCDIAKKYSSTKLLWNRE